MQSLPIDVLDRVLRRVPALDRALARTVCKAWRDVVPPRRLLLDRTRRPALSDAQALLLIQQIWTTTVVGKETNVHYAVSLVVHLAAGCGLAPLLWCRAQPDCPYDADMLTTDWMRHAACRTGRVDVMQWIEERDPGPGKWHANHFAAAARGGHDDAMAWLLERGAVTARQLKLMRLSGLCVP
jgi:hypothetical protein